MVQKTVLLVEDEDNIALALSHLLGRMGLSAHRVADGDSAMDAINQLRPDLVVLDVMLPGTSGYEICQEVRKTPGLDSTKILMMTARGGAVERRKGLALGADAFLTKPFPTHDFTAKVAELIEEA